MEYRKLGHSGVIVSVVALGSMQFGRGMNMGNLDQDAAREMIRFALDQGRFITAQMYYSLVGRELEHEWIPFAQYADIGILVWSPLAGGYLSGKYQPDQPAPAGTRFAEAGQFVPVDETRGARILQVVRQVAERHHVSPARVALAWTLRRPMVSSVIIAARSLAHLEDNIRAVDLKLTADGLAELDRVSDPGVPYPKWMVLQLDQAEDPRPRVLEPNRFIDGGPWRDLRGRKR